MHHIRDKVNEVPENVPAYFVVNRTVRSQYRYPSCDMVHSVSRRYTPVKEYSDIVVYDCWPGGRGFWLWTVTALCSVTARKMISGIREAVGRADDATAYSMVERSGTSSLAAGCAGETAVVASLTTG